MNSHSQSDAATNAAETELLGDGVLVASTATSSSESSESLSDNDTEASDPHEKSALQPAEQTTTGEDDKTTIRANPSAETAADILIAIKVLQVIETYGIHGDALWQGLAGYVPLLVEQVKASGPIRLMFSGFGFKSPSQEKVLGSLPDLGERLALAHLDGLCSNIAAVYKKGAEMHICSDGLVYNDLFDVSDESVWLYGNKLEQMAKSSDLHHIRFHHLGDVLGYEAGIWTKEYTAAHAPCVRRELLYRYTDTTSSPGSGEGDEPIHDFVDRMLSPNKAERRSNLVSALRTRWNAYESAIQTNMNEFVQLSSHDFGAAQGSNRLIISLLPQSDTSKAPAPWHSVIVVQSDGSYRASIVNELRNDQTYELISDATGTPSHYRTRDEIWNWKADDLDVTFEHLYPTGTIIRPNSSHAGSAPSIQRLPMRKVRLLSQRFSPVVLRGFQETTNEEYFLAKGNELGEIMSWTFGQILKVKDSGEVEKDANNVTSNEAMPMHFDGIFKFVDTVDPETGETKKVLTPPRYQYFTCLSTAPKGDGYTLFANSRLFFRYLPSPFTFSHLERATWSMVNDGFWSAKQTELPLIVRHKETGEACLRWHEPWTNTKFSKYYIEIENDEEGPQLIEVINKLLYDYRVCLRFEWEQGDLLINDNVSMLHTRTAFAGNCEREMWRIHFD